MPAAWVLIGLSGSCGLLNYGPPIGHPIPKFLAKDLTGQSKLISLASMPCILFFYSPSCQPCKRLLENLHSYFEDKQNPKISVLLLTKQWEGNNENLPKTGFPILAIGRSTWEGTFNITRTPALLFYEAGGRLLCKQLGWRPRPIQTGILDQFSRSVQESIPIDSTILRNPFSRVAKKETPHPRRQKERSSKT